MVSGKLQVKHFQAKHFILGAFFFVSTLILITSIGSAFFLKDREIETWRRLLGNLSLVLAEQTYQTMASSQIAMDSIVEHISGMGIRNAAELRTMAKNEAMFRTLRDKISGLPQVDVATIVAANGDVINFTRSFPPPSINLADRDYFQARREDPGLGIFIGQAVRNKGNGKWVFYLSHRLNDSRGQFMGLVLVGISVDQFTDFYQRLGKNLGEGAAVTLYRHDFSLLARWPRQDELIGKQNLTGTSHLVVEEMKKTDDVIYSAGPRFSNSGFSVARLGAVRVLDRFPLIVNLTVTEDYFLANWRQSVKSIAAVASGSILALVIATYFLLRIVRQREQSTSLLRELTDQVPGLLFQFQLFPDGRFSFPYINQGFLNAYGLTPEQLPLDGSKILSYLHPEDKNRFLESIQISARSLQPWREDYRMVLPDLGVVWRHGDAHPQKMTDGSILWHGYISDITERKNTEAELRIAATAFDTREGMLITDSNCSILRVNSSFCSITGYTAEEVIGKNPRILGSGRQDPKFYANMWKNLNDSGVWEGEIWNRRKNGEIYPEHLTITTVKDSNGSITNFVGSFTDITLRKLAEEEIRTLAFYDTLTRLPNRRLLLDRLQQALASSARSGRQGALLFIDLDNFKALNDTLGHDSGDLLLQQVAQRLETCVREGDTVARLGGDEFVVMLEELGMHPLEAAAQTESVGQKILSTLNQPYHLGQHEHHSTPSIGATLFHNHDREIEELYKQADIAMYQSKKAGRNTLRFFDPQMQDTINIRAALEDDLRKALERQQFQLYFQIQVDDTHRPLGAEVLIRWLHPERGMVSPAQFIPLAEETGLILPIGQWVLEMACAQIRQWEQDARTSGLVLAVNVSASQFRQPDFVAQVHAAIQRHACKPMLLKLELTESMLQTDIEDTISTMNALKDLGVQFSLDDFGTGYSSLQYLKRLPLDQLKIDQSFVRDIATDSSDKAIVSTIIAMAHSMNLDVIAEGVETHEQRQFLLDSGCTHFQGYLFGKPVPLEQFAKSYSQI